jgi:hypothetical protein
VVIGTQMARAQIQNRAGQTPCLHRIFESINHCEMGAMNKISTNIAKKIIRVLVHKPARLTVLGSSNATPCLCHAGSRLDGSRSPSGTLAEDMALFISSLEDEGFTIVDHGEH